MLLDLNHINLFKDLDEETQELVKKHFEPYSCPAETVIFKQGDPAIFLYLLVRGRVTLIYKPYDGPPINLTQIHHGGAFGWSAVIGNPVYTSGIVAREAVQAIRIRGTDLRKLVRDHPRSGSQLLNKLARLVSNRWKDANLQVRTILEESIAQKQKPRRKEVGT